MSTKWRSSPPAYPASSPEKDLAWALEMDSLLDSVPPCYLACGLFTPSGGPAGGDVKESEKAASGWGWDWLRVPLPITLPTSWPA